MVVMDEWAIVIAICTALLIGYYGYSMVIEMAG
jgi:hypothetical protein